jgi:hypothetical protein
VLVKKKGSIYNWTAGEIAYRVVFWVVLIAVIAYPVVAGLT